MDGKMIGYEAAVAMAERTVRRLWILCIILVILLVGSNVLWICYESQFERYEETTIEAKQDGAGINIVGGGDVNYGSESSSNN